MSKFCSPDVEPPRTGRGSDLEPSVFSFSRTTLFENREAPGDEVTKEQEIEVSST